MKKLFFITLLISLIAGYSATLIADNDEHEGREHKGKGAKTGFVVSDATYLKESVVHVILRINLTCCQLFLGKV